MSHMTIGSNNYSPAEEWIRDMREIKGFGTGLSFDGDDFTDINLDNEYSSFKRAAEGRTLGTYGDRVERHPDFNLICSLFAFSEVYYRVGNPAKGVLFRRSAEGIADWINSSYNDPENPFPFKGVEDASKRKVRNKKNAKLLDVFLKGI